MTQRSYTTLRGTICCGGGCGGKSRHAAAAQFAVSPSSAIRWVQRWEVTGEVAAKPTGGSISPLEDHQAEWTRFALCWTSARSRRAGSRCAGSSPGTNSALKKILHASEQERADVAAARQRWRTDQPSLDPARLVFIDETGTSTNMARSRGRARRGTRLVGRVPHGHWKITTFVAGLRCGEIAAPFVIDRPMNSAIFLTYVTRCLAPTLKPGDIVVMARHHNCRCTDRYRLQGAQSAPTCDHSSSATLGRRECSHSHPTTAIRVIRSGVRSVP